jgi:hypothetical protein
MTKRVHLSLSDRTHSLLIAATSKLSEKDGTDYSMSHVARLAIARFARALDADVEVQP